MTSSGSNLLAALPYELIHEISQNLDKASLKAFRLAYPIPKVSNATSKLLFKTIELRLGTLEWSLHGAKSRLSFLESLASANQDSWDQPLLNCEKLLIDTRYPWIVNVEDCLKFQRERGSAADLADGREYEPYDLSSLQVLISEEEGAEFLELIRGVLAAARDLRVIEWRTGSAVPIKLHKGISSLICKPARTRNYTLDIAATVTTFDEKSEYLDCLAHAQYVAIKVASPSPHRGDHHALQEMREVGQVVWRCPGIKGFEFYSAAPVFAYQTSDDLRDSLRGLNGLEIFRVDTNLGFTHEMDWTSLKDLKDLWLSVEGSVTHYDDLDELFTGLKQVGTKLNKFSAETYISPTHEYLLEHCNLLTELEIWGLWSSSDVIDVIHAFWDSVIPRHAPTLKRLVIQNWTTWDDFHWNWNGKSNNKPRQALPKCKVLEHLGISASEGSKTWITEMIEELVPSCPKLAIINMLFLRDNAEMEFKQIDTINEKLTNWSSTSKAFNGRSLTLKSEDATKGPVCFPAKNKPGTIPPLWYDRLVQSWQLVRTTTKKEGSPEENTAYQFERLDDFYFLDERMVEDGGSLIPFVTGS